jgi:hypothetical protein
MLYPSARGLLYLLLALTLLAQRDSFLWVAGYTVEVLGIVHVLLGSRANANIAKLRTQMGGTRGVLAAYRALQPDGRLIGAFGLQMLANAASVKLRWRADQLCLLHMLDLDRDGLITEADLVHWLGTQGDGSAEDDAEDTSDDDDAEQGGEGTAARQTDEEAARAPPATELPSDASG